MPLFAAQFVISKSQKCAWLVSQNREAHRNRRTNLSMPTIGESAYNAANPDIYDSVESDLQSSNIRMARRARSMKLPATSHKSLGANVSRSFRRRSPAALEVPGKSARNSRRHSYQAGVPGLAKEMDRLKVGSTTGSSPAGSSRGASPRSSTKRRPSVRRSSRSGFLHFLDLAIAN